jgi:pilus assembly protein CpaB
MNERKALVVSGVAGLLAAVLAWAWFAQKGRALDEMSAPAPALVSSAHIASGARLDKSMVELKQVPRAFIQPGALKSVAEAEGLVALAPFAPGEQVLANKLTTTGLALALAVPPGKRAVTIAADAASSVAGLLKPGDLVDVLATVEEAGSLRTFALIQASPVLAVGNSFGPQAAAPEGGVLAGSSGETITLAVSPYEAGQVTHLEQVGRIKLVLRAQGDRERIPLPVISGDRGLRPSAGDEEVRKR